jgi:HK97 family phage major capsid protein
MSTTEFVDQLTAARERSQSEATRILQAAKSRGATTLSELEQRAVDGHMRDYRALTERIGQESEDLARSSRIPASLRVRGQTTRALNTGAHVAPMGFDPEDLHRAYNKLCAGEAVRLEARAFATASPLLPAELAPWVTELQHEGRILDHLPAYAIDTPSIEIVQVNSVTGAAGIVAEGQVKPEVTPVTTPLTVPALKVAAHTGLSYEALADFDAFSNYVRIELQQQVVLTENNSLLYGTGGTGSLNGFFTASGILTFDATTADQGIDAIEMGIEALRTGASLATPDLCVLHPSTWSAIRRTKDTLGRYLLSADPTTEEADSIWGLSVVVTTQCAPADGLLVDTTRYGRAVVREPLSMRIGWANDDFVKNILRTVCEERLNNAIERPTAICKITGLPTAAVTEAKATKASSSK